MSKPDKNDGKRRRSSDGKTPRPSTKTVKMADNETGSSSGAGAGSGLVDKMTVIAEAVQELQKGQQSLQSMVETEPDGNRKENCILVFGAQRMETRVPHIWRDRMTWRMLETQPNITVKD
uniref:Uncharacterized protein n=1 Tax=Magallana gigas TaxID=29159 RepID=A0A8W8LY41_MAGGI